MALRFDQREIGRTDITVRTEHGEVVRKAGHADTLVGLQTVLAPEPVQGRAAGADDRVCRRRVVLAGEHLEPGGEDQHLHLLVCAVGGHHTRAGDRGDRLGDEVDVVPVERGQIRVVEAGPLTTHRVAWRQLVPHHRIVHLPAQIRPSGRIHPPGQRVDGEVLGGQRKRELHVGLAEQPLHGAAERQPHQPPRRRRQRHIEFGEAPDRCALEDRQVIHQRGDLGDHLDRRRAGADDGNAFSAQLQCVVPARGVDRRAAELLDAGDVRQVGHRQHPAGVDQEAGADLLLPARGLEVENPDVVGVVERGAQHGGAEADLRSQAVLVDTVGGVVGQLGAGRVGPRPFGALLEGELVGERRDVDRDPGIGVPVPRAARLLAGLDDQVVVHPGAIELDRGADAGEPGTDDDDVVVRCAMRCGHRDPRFEVRPVSTCVGRPAARPARGRWLRPPQGPPRRS